MDFIKIGVASLFITFTQYIIVMLYTQWIVFKKLQYFNSADPLEDEVFNGFWTIFSIEVLLSSALLIIGLYKYFKTKTD